MADVLEREVRLAQHAHALFPTSTAVTSSEWSHRVTVSNVINVVAFDWETGVSSNEIEITWRGVFSDLFTAAIPTVCIPVSAKVVEDETFDPAIVKEIKAADAAAPEAQFNNVVDMLDWLNRD
jgi:hypothetical protein